jgi:predicted  nucleic acid-binding Zn-ribbon protein|tara:strand:+ start:191 stop:439 length:249 start_codon:yes stop_codon:yes gene_type:complete
MANNTVEELKLELEKSNNEIKILKSKYENQVGGLKKEVSYLKEQLMAQQDMLKMAVDYANRLGKELKALKKRIDSGNFQSIH